MADTRTYRARNGATQHMPSLELAQQLAEDLEGFCLACGATSAGIEPDARRVCCEACGAHKVYGAEELVLMGLVF